MGIPIVYRKNADSAMQSFDYFDYATGSGYKTYYAGAADLSGSDVYFLTNRTVESDRDTTSQSITVSNAVWSSQTNSFDVTFNTPQVVSGNAIVSATVQFADPTSFYLDVFLYRVDSSGTENLIGRATAPTETTTGASRTVRLTLSVSLTTTYIKVGEIIRFKYIHYGMKNGAGTASQTIYFDPASLVTFTEFGSGRTIGSDIMIDLPFRIDL